MKLFKVSHVEDYGHEWSLDLLVFKRFKVVGIYVSWSDYSGSFCMQVSSGMGGILDALIAVGKLSIEVSLGCRNHIITGQEPWLDQ